MNKQNWLSNVTIWLSFLFSTTTLVCCVLPILFTLFGFGSTLAALTMNTQLINTLSAYKFELFFSSGIVLILSSWIQIRSADTCPIDANLKNKCLRLKFFNKLLLALSKVVWLLSYSVAYLALPIRLWIEN